MRKVPLALLSMALAGTTVLSLPGCGGAQPTREQAVSQYSAELRSAVSAQVADEKRRARLLGTVDQVEALQRRFTQDTTEFIEAYRRLDADPGATRPAFERLFADYGNKRVAARNEALDLHLQLAALTTAAEWQAIGKAEARLYENTNDALPAAGHAT